MALSKIKNKKQRARLKARQDEWDKIPADKKYGKSGKPTFSKPGSNKK